MILTPLAASAVEIPYGSCSSGDQRIVVAAEDFKRIYIADGDKLTSMWLGKNGKFYQSRVITEKYYAASLRRSLGNRIIDMASLRTKPLYYKDASGKYFKLVVSTDKRGLVLTPVPLTDSELADVESKLGTCKSDGSSSSGGGSSGGDDDDDGDGDGDGDGGDGDDPDIDPIDDSPTDDGPGHGGSRPICELTHTCGGGSTSSSGANPIVGLSGLPWNSGNWVNGGNDRIQVFENFRNRPADVVTQSIPNRYETWAGFAGADSDAQVNAEFAQPPASFRPTFSGVFSGSNWFRHVWGTAVPAPQHRQRIIHLAWMDPIPNNVGNAWRDGHYENPRVWQQIKDGSADKYAFLLGRKMAYLDNQYGDTRYPMTIDLAYEWTLQTHNQLPEGSYMDGGTKRYAYQDFPYGWSRMVKAIKEGYKYQRGRDCPYRFSWRPQLRFINSDRAGGGSTIRHEELWPNNVAGWAPGAVTIDGVTVIPAGPIGRTADIVGVSWHDSSKEMVNGSTAAAGNWENIYRGYPTHWGLQEMADFARAQGVHMAFPEWAARRGSHPPASAKPGDVYRMTYEFFRRNAGVMAYETVFDIGSGAFYGAWEPVQPAAQNPGTVYKELWGR